MEKHILNDSELEAVTGGRGIKPCPYQKRRPDSDCGADGLNCPEYSCEIVPRRTITHYCGNNKLVSWQELLPGNVDL